MNILPKKSWHVRNRDNIAKVKRDEAHAAEEEKKKEARIALAEQEARTELLRIKAKEKYGEGKGPSPQGPSAAPFQSLSQLTPPGPRDHINFFSELESGGKTAATNKDNEAEKKKEQEEYEKKIGLLTYLGQSSAEMQAVKPWYQQGRKREEKTEQADADKNDMKRKAAMDPMNDMMRYLGKKPKTGAEKKTGNQKDDPLPSATSSSSEALPGTSSLLSKFSKYRHKSKQTIDESKPSRSEKHGDKNRSRDHDRSRPERCQSRNHRKKSHKKEKKKKKKHREHKQRSRHRQESETESQSDESVGMRRHRKSHRRRSPKGEESRKKHRDDFSYETFGNSDSSDSVKESKGKNVSTKGHRKLQRRKNSRGEISRRKHRRESSSDSSDSDGDTDSSRSPCPHKSKPGPTIEQLRAERLRREAKERTKTERLLSGQPLQDTAPAEPQITDKLDGKYNSQFNPHLARKHQPKAPMF